MSDICKLYINNEEYTLIKNYKDIEKYRKSLNRLVKSNFGFDFEDWYQKGFWTDKYIPYSLLFQDEVVANISINPIDFLIDKKIVKTLQIGTVATEEAFRHRGLSRALMEIILREQDASCELIYLYANDTVLDFYPKFGFQKADEYIYSKSFNQDSNKLSKRKLIMNRESDLALITRLVNHTIPISKVQMLGNPGLIFFYLISFMSDNIFYFDEIDLAAVVEIEDNAIKLIDIFSEKSFDLNKVIQSLVEKDGTKVSLGFTPMQTDSFDCEKLREEELTFFINKDCLIDKSRFPALSHA